MAKANKTALSPDLGARERQYVYSVAMKYLKDEDAAEDVTQDALLLAHLHRDSFRGDSRFSTWLYRVAATTALMHLRRRRRRGREVQVAARPGDGGPAAAELVERRDPRTGPDAQAGAREEIAAIDARLRAMGPRYRDVFWLRFAGGLSEQEIADGLGLHLSTVKTRTHRARVAIRAALAEPASRAA
ncbi:MAG TPA: sigma-70 family RNA polymerase sigma factor [Kofleriaceae bacterium]|nr:sigma-70 family RNA polymerase sigma factor [Kofleriaceae bacterium]